MQCNYMNVQIKRDIHEIIPACIPATEIPVLARVHGGSLTVLDAADNVYEFDELDEFDRLRRAYGEKDGVSFAEMAYGGPSGIVDMMAQAPDDVGGKRKAKARADA